MSSEYQELLEKLLNSDTTDVIPQSRAEHIMLTAINSLDIDTLPKPGSRMEAYLMALITKMGEGGSASQMQSDWNQNDSTAADYVKRWIWKVSQLSPPPTTANSSVLSMEPGPQLLSLVQRRRVSNG